MRKIDLSGQSVLVLENDYFISWDIKQLLWELSAHVIGPFSQECLALESFKTITPTWAMLDVHLDGGPSFLLAEDLLLRQIPFVFATSYDRSKIPMKFNDIQILSKPFGSPEIARAFSNTNVR